MESAKRFDAAHHRHGHIQDHERDLTRQCRKHFHSIASILSGDDAIPAPLERHSRGLQDYGFVIDDEDSAALGMVDARRGWQRLDRAPVGGGQKHREMRSTPRSSLDVDTSVMTAHDAERGR